MLKYILFVLGSIFFINATKCQMADTAFFYYKTNYFGHIRKVSTLDSADFVRAILAPDPGESFFNVKEFCRNGKIKFIGKTDPDVLNADPKKTGVLFLTGDCINYFPSGKRQSITHYSRGQKDGDEYLFYPDGRIYCYLKNRFKKGDFTPATLYWECYNKNGDMICKAGNGNWIRYDQDFNVLLQGQVKNGLYEGDWHGSGMLDDSIKYIYKYSKGVFVSGITYDKSGTAYPFVEDIARAGYKGDFLRKFESEFRMPKEVDEKNISFDSDSLSFIVEREGSLSHPQVLGITDPALDSALINALMKCSGWYPRKNYGIPLRSQITFPLKDLIDEIKNVNHGTKVVFYKDKELSF